MDLKIRNGQQASGKSAESGQLLQQYGVGSTRFAGAPDALYERHLKFDNVVEPESADARERFEAAARSVRDILSERWLRTDETYFRENPKRVYYLSIEFLIGRSLANNVMNLMLDPVIEQTFDEQGRQWIEILDEEPDAGLGNGGLGRLAACFLNSMATLGLPAMGSACATSTASSDRNFATAGRRSARTTGCFTPIRGRSCAREKASR